MFNRRVVLRACGAFLGLVLAAGTVTTLSASTSPSLRPDRLEYLTFSGHFGLPGVTLSAGKYAFELANPDASADIIRVRNMATNQVVFLGFTYRVARPKGMALDRLIVFGEAPRGTATPVLAWYPSGDTTGHQFKYGDRPAGGDRR